MVKICFIISLQQVPQQDTSSHNIDPNPTIDIAGPSSTTQQTTTTGNLENFNLTFIIRLRSQNRISSKCGIKILFVFSESEVLK